VSDPVVVIAIFTPVAGKLAELRQALVASIPAVHTEAGCELYAIHDGPDDTIYMIEKWTTEAELDTHGAGEPVKALQAATAGLSDGAEVLRMYPIPAGTDAQGLL
jgi:quinol monooxygenase YgiN